MKIFNFNYILSLEGVDRDRYDAKIKLCEGIDPYELDFSVLKADNLNLPDVEHGDVYEYLVNTTNTVSMIQMKNYKSLESHNFFTSGFVQDLRYKELTHILLIFGVVKHSYSLNEAPLKNWIAIKRDGQVITAHCNCMAGVGESCSHVGAILFALVYATHKRKEVTCTSKGNQWLPPALQKVPCIEVRESSYESAKRKWSEAYIIKEVDEGKQSVTRKKLKTVPCTEEELNKFLKKLADHGDNCSLMTIDPDLCQAYERKERPAELPVPLSNLYKKENINLSLEELKQKGEEVFKGLILTEDQILAVEKASRQQRKSKSWMHYRAGRITASNMKSCCRTNPEDPSISLLSQVCYPGDRKAVSKYEKFGIQHEPDAREAYQKFMKTRHKNFKIQDSGLRIDKEFAFIGASPDGIISCDCHGTGLLEIKCSYYSKEDSCGLKGGVLEEDHKYSYQVQTQLMVCKYDFCDFVVWFEDKPLTINRIWKNAIFQDGIVRQATLFFKKAVLPELLGKYFSSRKNTALQDLNYDPSLTCICQKPAYHPMITCQNLMCNIKRFHWACVQVKGKRKSWFCSDCSAKKKKNNYL